MQLVGDIVSIELICEIASTAVSLSCEILLSAGAVLQLHHSSPISADTMTISTQCTLQVTGPERV